MNKSFANSSTHLQWDDLKYFLAIAEEGSLSAAAKRLFVSQPTLSRRLAALEEQIGTALFTRSRTGQNLTTLGEQVYAKVCHMRDDVFAVERLVTGQDSDLDGSVVISCIDVIGTNWLVRKLKPFHTQFPNITTEIKVEGSASDLLRREADIAMRMFRPVQNDLIAKLTVSMNYGYYASKGYIEEHGMPQTLEDMKNHNYVLPHDEILALTSKRYKRRTFDSRLVFRSNSFMALQTAVKEGYGIGAYSCLSADADPDLVRLFDDLVVFSSGIWLVSHTELRRSARIRKMYDYLSDLLISHKAQFEGSG